MNHFPTLFALALCTPLVHGAEPARSAFNAKATQRLELAAQRGDRASAACAIDDGADVNAKDRCGWTPLHWATYKGHEAIVSFLIDNGADMNAKTTSYNLTPLHFAVREEHEAIVQLLIDKGADINAKDKRGWTSLHHAAKIQS